MRLEQQSQLTVPIRNKEKNIKMNESKYNEQFIVITNPGTEEESIYFVEGDYQYNFGVEIDKAFSMRGVYRKSFKDIESAHRFVKSLWPQW